jgi:hypothetical protein
MQDVDETHPIQKCWVRLPLASQWNSHIISSSLFRRVTSMEAASLYGHICLLHSQRSTSIGAAGDTNKDILTLLMPIMCRLPLEDSMIPFVVPSSSMTTNTLHANPAGMTTTTFTTTTPPTGAVEEAMNVPPPPPPPDLGKFGTTSDLTGGHLWSANLVLCYTLLHYFFTPSSTTSTCNSGRQVRECTSVCELGAGVGLCASLFSYLHAATRSKSSGVNKEANETKSQSSIFHVTDGSEPVMTLLKQNIDIYNNHYGVASSSTSSSPSNSLGLSCHRLFWGDAHDIKAALSMLHSPSPASPVSSPATTATTVVGYDVVIGADLAYLNSPIRLLMKTVVSLLSHKPSSRFWLSCRVSFLACFSATLAATLVSKDVVNEWLRVDMNRIEVVKHNSVKLLNVP